MATSLSLCRNLFKCLRNSNMPITVKTYSFQLPQVGSKSAFSQLASIKSESKTLLFNLKSIRRNWNSQNSNRPKPRIKRISLKPQNAESDTQFIAEYQWLVRPLAFTFVFSGCTFVGAAIWQYENMRKHAVNIWKRQTGWINDRWNARSRNTLSDYWNNLNDGQTLALGIVAINFIVFALWRVPAAQNVMIKYFCSNPVSKAVCWPMILSTFSHHTFWHFAINMYVLYSFAAPLTYVLGKEQFLALYLSGGVVSSFTSYFYKVITSKAGFSLGASGCIMAALGFYCTQFPDSRLSIVFLPMFSFSAQQAIYGVVCLDTLGVLLGWKFFDHAAHLGGVLFGIGYALWGRELIWNKREPLLRWWNSIRGGVK